MTMSADVISEKDLANLKEQLNNVRGDKDRLRLLSQAAGNWKFECWQIADIIKVAHYGDAITQVAIKLYPTVVDKQNFHYVIDAYKYADDKKTVKDALGLK